METIIKILSLNEALHSIYNYYDVIFLAKIEKVKNGKLLIYSTSLINNEQKTEINVQTNKNNKGAGSMFGMIRENTVIGWYKPKHSK